LFDWLRRDAYYANFLEITAVALAALPLWFPTLRPGLTVFVLVLLAGVWLLRWAVRREPWPFTPLSGALLLFALTIPIGVWASAFPDVTLPKLTGLILGLAAFRALAYAVHDRPTLAWALAVLALVGLAILAVGVLGVGWPEKFALFKPLVRRIPKLLALTGAAASTINPNELGGALTLYVPLAAACAAGWLAERRFGPALLALVGLALAAATLLLTQSRGALLGATAGLGLLLILWGLRDRRRAVRILAVAAPILVLLLLAAGVLYLGPDRIGHALTGSNSAADPFGGVGSLSLSGRQEIWSRAVYAIQDFPFTGCGLGAFRRVVNLLYPLLHSSPKTDIGHAHNIFLQTALDLGLPGLVAYLALLLAAVATAWQVARRSSVVDAVEDPLVTAVALGLIAGRAALHTYGLTDAIALGAKPNLSFWLALGLIASLPRLQSAAPIPRRSRS
jgi:putative inorganic carbon (hco3(-)) transporter